MHPGAGRARSGVNFRAGQQDVAFVSFQFVAFLAIVAAVHFTLPLKARWIWLLAASLFFYGFAEPIYLVQILAATAVSFWFALRIEAAQGKPAKQRYLFPAILLLVANLVVFKYAPFLNETLRGAFGLAGAEYPIPALKWLLPLGISFYTFQLISYLVDTFRGAKAERQFGPFALYVSFFPKLVAGPIERGRNLLPQIHTEHRFDHARIVEGLQLILWGAVQKIVIADRIAPFVDAVFNDVEFHTGPTFIAAIFFYAFQLYADFAGYTNMALGIALIFGYRLTQNFNNPYFAVSIQDFWKRWHISLTSWLTDYVYTPLTRQKTLKIKLFDLMLYSLLITFIVSGLWHGAGWTFILWGALHGTYIVVSLLLQKRWNNFARAIKLNERPNLYRALKMGVTFTLVCFAYILFRANDLWDVGYVLGHLGTGWGALPSAAADFVNYEFGAFAAALAGIVVMIAADILRGRVDLRAILTPRPALRWTAYYAGAVAIGVLGAFWGASNQFIYFRF